MLANEASKRPDFHELEKIFDSLMPPELCRETDLEEEDEFLDIHFQTPSYFGFKQIEEVGTTPWASEPKGELEEWLHKPFRTSRQEKEELMVFLG
jgi:hypothetical protein